MTTSRRGIRVCRFLQSCPLEFREKEKWKIGFGFMNGIRKERRTFWSLTVEPERMVAVVDDDELLSLMRWKFWSVGIFKFLFIYLFKFCGLWGPLGNHIFVLVERHC